MYNYCSTIGGENNFNGVRYIEHQRGGGGVCGLGYPPPTVSTFWKFEYTKVQVFGALLSSNYQFWLKMYNNCSRAYGVENRFYVTC